MVFNPDFVSATKPAIAIQEFKTIAESLHGKIKEELISLIKKGDEEPLRKFINDNFSPRFRDAVPLTTSPSRLKINCP